MSEILVIKEPIEEDTSPYFFRRLVDGFGVALTRASVTANGVTLRVYNLSGDDPNTVVLTLSSLDPSTSYGGHTLMYDTLQTTGWTKDSIGYNFFHLPDITSLATSGSYGGCVLRWCYEFQLAIGGKAWAIFETPIRSMKSS